jgi:hypothetical protein
MERGLDPIVFELDRIHSVEFCEFETTLNLNSLAQLCITIRKLHVSTLISIIIRLKYVVIKIRKNATCTIHHQYSENNMMHFLFNLLSIKGIYMFPALLTHPQDALHKRHLVYYVCVMSVGCTRIGVERGNRRVEKTS